jgi:transcriptional regulator of acetoin/glycerol metabolism
VLPPAGERAGVSLIAVDEGDLVVGATRAARIAFGISAERLERPIPARDLIGGGQAHDDRIEAAERAVLKRALARSGGNVSKAARDLDVSRATLHRKMNQLGLRR